MSQSAVVFAGVILISAAGLALRLLTHPPRRRSPVGRLPSDPRSERWRARRRAVMVGGLVLVAAAFFFGVGFLPARGGSRAAAVLFVTYWTAVMALTLGLLVLALVDLALLRRRWSRKDGEAFTRGRRRRAQGRGEDEADGQEK